VLINEIEAIRIAAHAATVSHKRQTRKNGITPYIVHPATVSNLVALYDNQCYDGMITAWLHDVLEDCGDDGKYMMNAVMVDMPLPWERKKGIYAAVRALTKNDSISPREAKWEDNLRRLLDKEVPRYAILVKVCDRIDNLSDMDGFKEGFREIYLDETETMIMKINRDLPYPMVLDQPLLRAFSDLVEIHKRLAESDKI
jgi:(p)ppGpp synthase/HD superfamily hydrolase